MAAKRSVVVAAGVSAALIASIGAFGVANGFIGDRPADRVGTFEPTAELRLVPAVASAGPESEPTPTTARGDDSPSTAGANSDTAPAATEQPTTNGSSRSGDRSADGGSAVEPPPAVPAAPTTARQGGSTDGSGDDHHDGTSGGSGDGSTGDD